MKVVFHTEKFVHNLANFKIIGVLNTILFKIFCNLKQDKLLNNYGK